MDILFFIIVIIVAILMERNRSYGPIGGRDVFSFSTNFSLDIIRDEYTRRLKIYYNDHKPRVYLKNKNCELRLIRDDKGTSFYCKEKPHGAKTGRFLKSREIVNMQAQCGQLLIWSLIV